MSEVKALLSEGKVAIVEDNAGFRMLLEDELLSHDLNVVLVADSAEHGDSALRARFEEIGSLNIDVLLLDKILGSGLGDRVANTARELAGDNVHIVSMSSLDSPEGDIAGMDKRLEKVAHVLGDYTVRYLIDKAESKQNPST